ncbi:dynein light chain, putative [Eimeria maxima]|uniref:Dynein light chain, putative n=1 Tax=Eimeria maxima TaxID=5804 RepID=U6M0J6_EIMMA|nr:dynein light chain, putative [Eimeria maxima]CDJ56598.1 dynein light chain, putative [Eimeria maxima]
MAAVRPPITDIDPESEVYQDALAQGAIAKARGAKYMEVLMALGQQRYPLVPQVGGQVKLQCHPYSLAQSATMLLMKKKERRGHVILECTEARAEGKPPSRGNDTVHWFFSYPRMVRAPNRCAQNAFFLMAGPRLDPGNMPFRRILCPKRLPCFPSYEVHS